jgi:type II secretory pathway component GspD/PulD (secretin)
MLWTKARIAVFCVLALGALGIGAALARQAGGPGSAADRATTKPAAAEEQPKAPAPAKKDAPKAEEKRFEFEMRELPWMKVFQWYADQTGLGCVCNIKPTGSFTFIPPKDKPKYTLEEVTDIINEALLARSDSQRFILVRRTTTFTVLPADEKVDPLLVPWVSIGALEKRAKTELVSVVVPLTATNAKQLADGVKKLLGVFGEVVVLEQGNRLVLRDTAENLRRITQLIKDIDTQAEKKQSAK